MTGTCDIRSTVGTLSYFLKVLLTGHRVDGGKDLLLSSGGTSRRRLWRRLLKKMFCLLNPDVVEIDGKIRSAYGIFVEALKAGLELKQKFPHSQIKVHDAEHCRIEN